MFASITVDMASNFLQQRNHELSRITIPSKLEGIRVDKWIWIAFAFAATEAKKKKFTSYCIQEGDLVVCIFVWIVYMLSYKLSGHIYIS